MTGKERIKNIIENKETDRIPFGILDGGAWIAANAGLTFRQMLELEDAGASIVVQAMKDIDCDMIPAASSFAVAVTEALGCKANLDVIGGTIDVETYITDLEEEIPKLDKANIPSMLENSWLFQRILHQTREMKKLIGDEKYINACITGPFTAAGILAGAQDLMMMLVDEEAEDDLAKLLDYSTEFCVQAYLKLHEAGVDIAWFGEPISSGAMISQDMFEDYAYEPIKNGYNRLKDVFEYIFIHMCGDSGARAASLSEIGFKAFSVDAVDMVKTAEAAGNMVILGNVSPSLPLHSGTPDEVFAAAKDAIEKNKAGNGRLILCPGCDVPVGTPIENLHAMLKATVK